MPFLPSERRLREETERAGLAWSSITRFGQDYADTLAHWGHRFDGAWDEIRRRLPPILQTQGRDAVGLVPQEPYLMAATARGVCFAQFGESEAALLADDTLGQFVEQAGGFIRQPRSASQAFVGLRKARPQAGQPGLAKPAAGIARIIVVRIVDRKSVV